MRFPDHRQSCIALALMALVAQAHAATVPPGCVRVSGEEGNGTDVYIGTTDAGEAIWCAAGSAMAAGGYGSVPAAPAAGGYGPPGYDTGGGYPQGGYGGTAAPQASGWGGQSGGQAGSSGGYGAAGGGYGGGGYGSGAGGYGGNAGGSGGFQGGSFGNKGSNVGGGANPYASGKTFEKREKGWKNKPPSASGTAGGGGYGAPLEGNGYGNAGSGYDYGGGAPASGGTDSADGYGPSSSQDSWPSQPPSGDAPSGFPPPPPYGSDGTGYDGGMPASNEPQGYADGGQGYGAGYGSDQPPLPQSGGSTSGKPLLVDPDRLRGAKSIDRGQLGKAQSIDPEALKKAADQAAPSDGSSGDRKPLPKLDFPLSPAQPAPKATLPQQAIDPARVDPQTLKNVSANPDAAIKAGAALKLGQPAAEAPTPAAGSKPKPKSIRSKKPEGG